jgi:histone H3/H4
MDRVDAIILQFEDHMISRSDIWRLVKEIKSLRVSLDASEALRNIEKDRASGSPREQGASA